MTIRVLHNVPTLNDYDGGPARSVPALAQAEAANGADVTVWSSTEPTIDLSPFPDVRFEWGDLSKLESSARRPHLLHDHGLWLKANHAAAKTGRHLRIPRIVSPRGMLEPWCLKHHRFRKRVAWQLYQHRDLRSSCGLHATSQSELAQFRRLGFQQPVISLPNGVTLPPERQLSVAKHTGDRQRTVLFLSRLHPVKNIHGLIDAWSKVSADSWHLRIIGSGDENYRRELHKQIQALDAGGRTSIEESIHSDKKWQLFKAADVVVLPSFSENFGIVVAEALGMGTPVIATTGMPWNGLCEHRCGWQVKPSVSGLRSALQAAVNTPELELQRMGERGKHWVEADFSWSDIGRRMLLAYDSILGKAANSATEAPVQTLRTAA